MDPGWSGQGHGAGRGIAQDLKLLERPLKKEVRTMRKWTKKDTMEIALSIVSGVSGSLLCMKVFGLI